MASGFCVRVLLLSLLAFGQHAKALSYRSGGSGGIKPHFELAEDFPSSYKPALASSSYEGSAPPGGSLNSYGPSNTGSGSSQNLKPAAAPSAGGYSGSYGRQVDRYSPEGSVSSYRPGPLMRQKPRQNPQQPHYKTNANANSVPQTKAGMWDLFLPQNGNRFVSGMASSYGMYSGRQSEAKPSYPAKPQQRSYPAKPQQRSYPAKPQQRSYPAKPQQPSYGVIQSKAGMWDLFLPQNGNRFESGMASSYGMHSGRQSEAKPQQPSYPAKPQQPSYPAKPQQPSYPAKPQQPSYPAKPQQPSYPAKPQQPSYPAKPQQPSYPAKPQQPSYPAKPQQPSYPAKPQQPSYPAKPQQPSYPAKPQQPSYPAKPQQPSYPAKPQQPSYPAKPQQPSYPAKPQQPSYPAKPQQPSYPAKPQQPSYPAKPQQPSYPAKPQQPSYPAKPQQPSYPAKPGVTQSKAGMWDIALPQGRVTPRSSRLIPVASVYHPRWQQQSVSVYNGFRRP